MSEEIEKLAVGLSLESGSFSKQMSAINKEVKNAERDFKSAGKGVEGFEKSFVGLDSKIQKTSKQLELYNTKLEKQKQEYDKLSSVVDKQKSKLDELENTVGKGSDEWKKQAELVQKNSEKLNRLSSDINQTESNINNLSNELYESVRAFEELGNKTKTIDEKLADVGRQANLTESEFNRLGTELQESGNYFANLGNDMNRLSSQIQQNAQKLKIYESEITKLSSTLDKSKEDHQQLSSQINQTENELNQAKSTYGENSTEVQQLNTKLLQLKDRYNEVENEIEQNSNALDEYQTEINNTQTEINQLSDELSRLPFDRVGNDLVNSGQKIKGLGQDLTSNVTVPILGVGAAAGVMSYQFDQGLAKVGSLVGKSGKEMKIYEADVLEVCKNLGIGTEDMTEAWYGAISAGVELGDSISFVESAGKLAVAGFTDTASSVDILTTSLNIYGDKAGTADEIANKLLLTQNKGKTTVDELASAMGQSLSIGGQYGVTFDNIATAFAKATLAGNTTADAGTQIKSMLSELGDSGSKVSKIIEEETGKSFKTLSEEGNSLSDILKIVQEKAQESGVGLGEMFSSSEAGLGAMSLLSEEGLNFNETLAEMSGELDLVDTGFKEMKDSAGAQLLDAINSLKLAIADMGDVLAPVIEWLAEKISELADWFGSLDEDAQKNIVTMAGLAMAIGPVLSGVGSLISVAGNATLAFGNVGGATGALTKTLGIFSGPAGIALAVGAILGLINMLGNNEDALATLQDKFGIVGKVIGTVCESITGATQLTFGNLVILVSGAAEAIGAVLSGKFWEVDDIVKKTWANVENNTAQAMSNFVGESSTALDLLKNTSQEKLKSVEDTFKIAMEQLPQITSENVGEVARVFTNNLSSLDTDSLTILRGTSDSMAVLFEGIREDMSNEDATNKFTANLESMVLSGKYNTDTLQEDIAKAMELINNNVSDGSTQMKQTSTDMFNTFKSSAQIGMEGAVQNVVGQLGTMNQETLTQLSGMGATWSSTFEGIKLDGSMSTEEMKTQVLNNINTMGIDSNELISKLRNESSAHWENIEKDATENTKQMATNVDANTKEAKDKADANTKELSNKVNQNTKDASSKSDTNTKDLSNKVDTNTKEAKNKADTNTKELSNKVNQNTQDASNKANTNSSKMATDYANNVNKMAIDGGKELSKVPADVDEQMAKAGQATKQHASDMYNGVTTSFSKMATNAKQSATDMYNGVTTSTSKMAEAAITDWENIRREYSKSINGTITITTVNRTVNETVSKGSSKGKTIEEMYNRNIELPNPINLSKYDLSGTYYSPDSNVSNVIKSISKSYLDFSKLEKKLDLIANILERQKNIKQENNINITAQEPLSPSQVAYNTRKELERLGRRL